MRSLFITAALVLAGCPADPSNPGGPVDADASVPTDAAVPDGGGACMDVSACEVTFRYPAQGATTVELRGDFAPDGWENGIRLERVGDHFETALSLEDGQTVRYKFVVNGTDWVTDPDNPNTVSDGFGGQNSILEASCDECSPTPFDWRDGIMYFVFTDRFRDGNPENNAPIDGVLPAANYQGGDLQGVIDAIESGYFADLGVNVLWLTAPYDNADGAGDGSDGYDYSSYHGYWPSDLDIVESRIGTLEKLQEVVDVAHQHGIKVVLDYVMNHVHSESPIYASHPDWFWTLEDCGVCGAPSCPWEGDLSRRQCWFTPYLPDFNFQIEAARDYSVDNAITWLEKTGVDGFRLDAVKHIEDQWVIDLRQRLQSEIEREGEVVYLVGETFTGDRGLIAHYVNPQTMLDGQFDFPMRAVVLETILMRYRPLTDLAGFLESNDNFYAAGSVMSTFIGNHDLGRVIHFAEEQPLWNSPWDAGRANGWENKPDLPVNAAPFERVALGFAVLFTSPGIPLIYYGDEIGLPGGGDPDNRRFMQWEGLSEHQVWLRDRLATFARIRHEHPALRRGQRSVLGATNDTLTYEMNGDGDRLVIALNRADFEAAAQGIPAGTYTDLITGNEVVVGGPLTLAPRTVQILEAK